MYEKEQIIEITGWHCWCDGDGIQKVDRCIFLGDAWHYHVIEDQDGKQSDFWTFDSEQEGEDPHIYSTLNAALVEEKRQQKESERSEEERRVMEDLEDAPIVAKLMAMPTNRMCRVIEKSSGNDIRFIMSWEKVRLFKRDKALDIFFRGGIDFSVNGRPAFIPLGSIDYVEKRGQSTAVVTKSGKVFLYADKDSLEVFTYALKIFNHH
jgi:hypothetical protein